MKKVLLFLFLGGCFIFLTACGSEEKKLDVEKTKSDKFEQLTYEVPEAFKKNTDLEENPNFNADYSLYSDYSYFFNDDDSFCHMSFFVNSGYEDMTLEDFTDINDNPNAVKKNINGIDWIRTEKKSEYDEEISYMYYAKYDNKFYGVFYSLSSSIDDSCLESLEVIEKSLKFED